MVHQHTTTDDGSTHIVGLAMRVLIYPDGEHWIAQGIDIDFLAYGSSVKAAQNNFESGLVATVNAHLNKFGNIDKLTKMLPKSEFDEIAKAAHSKRMSFAQVSVHEFDEPIQGLAYDSIEYLKAA